MNAAITYALLLVAVATVAWAQACKYNCRRKADGNYPCDLGCQSGYYYSCTKGFASVMPCPLGWYVNSNGYRYTDRMVYDKQLGVCVLSTPFCPREQKSGKGPKPGK